MVTEIKTEWIICPICGKKTHNKIKEDIERRFFNAYRLSLSKDFLCSLAGAFRFAVFPKRLITFNPIQYVV